MTNSKNPTTQRPPDLIGFRAGEVRLFLLFLFVCLFFYSFRFLLSTNAEQERRSGGRRRRRSGADADRSDAAVHHPVR